MNSSSTQVPSSVGPAVLLIPLLVGVLGLFWARSRDNGPLGQRPSAPQERSLDQVDLWTGSLDFPGGRLVAELSALHLDPARQQQDAQILARRFDLPEGQPWRLRVRLDAEQGAMLDPEHLQLISSGSACLAPLGSIQGSPGHPLLPLLAASPRSLGGPSPTDVILWGPEPGVTAQLEGLPEVTGEGSIELTRATGVAWERRGELAVRDGGGVR